MENYKETKERFLKSFDLEKLTDKLLALDCADAVAGDYCGFGCEFILNGINPMSDTFSIFDYLEDTDYEGYMKHYFKLRKDWDTYLFFNPSDFKGLIFDFSSLYDKNKVVAYNGIIGGNEEFKYEPVIEFTPEEFLKEYGVKKLLSCTHYVVYWDKLGIGWKN